MRVAFEGRTEVKVEEVHSVERDARLNWKLAINERTNESFMLPTKEWEIGKTEISCSQDSSYQGGMHPPKYLPSQPAKA